jgi:hypothetical protein
VLKTADFSKMADCTKSLISLSDFDQWFASDFDRWLASVQTAVVHHSPTDGSQHPKTADRPSLMKGMAQSQEEATLTNTEIKQSEANAINDEGRDKLIDKTMDPIDGLEPGP